MRLIRRMLLSGTSIVACIGIGVAGANPPAPGSLDAVFGVGGIAALPQPMEIARILPRADGAHFLAGSSYVDGGVAMLSKFRADGMPDTGFGVNGTVVTAIPSGAHVASAAMGPETKIVTLLDRPMLGLVRYLPDGALDATFGNGGIVLTPVVGGFAARNVHVMASGASIVVGSRPSGNTYGVAIVRYDRNGAIDYSLGTTGIQSIPSEQLGGAPSDSLLDASGALLVAAGSKILRLNGQGAIDASFGAGGIADVPFSITGLAIAADGSVVVAGVDTLLARIALFKLTADGHPSLTFGNQARVTVPLAAPEVVTCAHNPPAPSPGARVIVQPDGALVVVATAFEYFNSGTICVDKKWWPVLARYRSDGTPDATFGSAGVAIGVPGFPVLPSASTGADRNLLLAYGAGTAKVARYLLDTAGTLVALTSDRNPAAAGERVTFTAKVTGRSSTGTVAFANRGVTIDACNGVPLVGSEATCSTPSYRATPGENPIAAFYSGDVSNAEALSLAYPQAVGPPGTGAAIEFHNAVLEDYVLASSPDEIATLDADAAWRRTGQFFLVFAPGSPGTAATCRFSSGSTFAPFRSHFYTPFAAECNALMTSKAWTLEGHAFAVALADGAGVCPAATLPLLRLFNAPLGFGVPRHRFTTDPVLAESLRRQSWIQEGNGPAIVAMCARDSASATAALR